MSRTAAAALPVLYTFRRCPYAMRARLTLGVSQLACEWREVALSNKPREMLMASPKGTVPVLVLPDGDVIDESLAIMRWSLAQNDPAQWLAPPGGTITGMLALIAENDTLFKRHLDRYKYPQRFVSEGGASRIDFAIEHRAAGAEWLRALADRLDASGKDCWLFGHRASLADMAVLPFVRQFAHTDAAWFAAQPWPRLQAWLARFEASTLYADMMRKQPLWTPPNPAMD